MVAIVADWDFPAGGELKSAVDDHFLTGGFSKSFGPFELLPAVSEYYPA